MRISDWSSDVCSSDLFDAGLLGEFLGVGHPLVDVALDELAPAQHAQLGTFLDLQVRGLRSEEHTSELQSLMRISYAVFCLKKKNKSHKTTILSYKKYH